MVGFGNLWIAPLMLHAVTAAIGQSQGSVDLDPSGGSYWLCEHAVMSANGVVHRSFVSAIVDDEGRIWRPTYEVIETNARYRFVARENWQQEGFQFGQMQAHSIRLSSPPTSPVWQRVLSDSRMIEQRLVVPPSSIVAGEAHETIMGMALSGSALSDMVNGEDWRLQLVDQDGQILAEQALKDRSRADMLEEQRSQIAWLRAAAETPGESCSRSTPDSRAADEASVI